MGPDSQCGKLIALRGTSGELRAVANSTTANASTSIEASAIRPAAGLERARVRGRRAGRRSGAIRGSKAELSDSAVAELLTVAGASATVPSP